MPRQYYTKKESETRTGSIAFTLFVILAIIGCAVLTVAAITVNSQNVSAHYIKSSDARIYRYDANSSYDVYYVTHVLYLDSSKTFAITLNGQGGLYGHETFTRVTFNNAALASRVNLTVTQLTCVNGSSRFIWGSMKVFTNEYGMFLHVNGSWYEDILNTQTEVNVCIQWALKNT